MHAALSGLNGVHCIGLADDILVAGSGDTVADAERDHDRNLLALLDRCRQKGIKLDRSKLCLRRESTRYMDHLHVIRSASRSSPNRCNNGHADPRRQEGFAESARYGYIPR